MTAEGEDRALSIVGRLMPDDAPHSLRRLAGGRNNQLYACQTGEREVCVKIYRKDSARRASHEWAALTALSHAGFDAAPEPLYYEAFRGPVVVMTLLPGVPLSGAPLDAGQIAQIAEIFHRMRLVGQNGHTEPIPPVRMSIGSMFDEVRGRWKSFTADHRSPLRKELFSRWECWLGGPDLAHLMQPSIPVLGQGDPNPSNYLWDGRRVRVVDFEYAGWSDMHHEFALLVEHVQSRATPDALWALLEELLFLSRDDRDRARAARVLVAWYWTVEFWPHQSADDEKFVSQAERLLRLLGE